MNMKNTLVMPKAGLTNTEGTVGAWKATEGSFVKKGEVALEIETEKATMDVNSSADGYIHIVAKEGDVVVVGGAMAYLLETKAEYDALVAGEKVPVEVKEVERPKEVDLSKEATAVVMPKAGLTNTEGTVREWKVVEGAEVKHGDVLLEIETEKATMDVNSLGDGFLHILAKAGDVVAVGGTIGSILPTKVAYEAAKNAKAVPVTTMQEEKATIPTPPTPIPIPAPVVTHVPVQTGGYVKASPLAKKIAREAKLDLALVVGTGPNGRVLERDVTKYLAEISRKPTYEPAPVVEDEEPTIIPMTPMRKAIAKNMYHSLQSMAQTSDSVEVDVTDLVALRKKLVKKEEKLGTRITLNDLLSFATLQMLKDHPLANATLREDSIVTYPYVNLSMAVATEYGLTSPVIPKADRLSLIELSKALNDIVVRARGGKLTPSELGGGTFTITNMGVFPVDQFNPIVNPPQSAIVGFGRCVEKPAVYEGQIAIRTMMFLNITYDHRVFDGSEVGSIMRDLKEYLENPELMLL